MGCCSSIPKIRRFVNPAIRQSSSSPTYVELHVRSAFSFLEGASLPEDLVGACAALDLPAMALLDRDGVYGSPRFHLAAEKAGIKAHIGAEVACEPLFKIDESTDFRIDEFGQLLGGDSNSSIRKFDNTKFPLLISSRTGYQNLCRLITKMKLRARKGEGAVREQELQEHAAGLICLTGGDDGPLAAALTQCGTEEARRCLERLIGIFGPENVYVELQRHFHREEESRNRAAVEIARSLQLPLLATNGVCYATAQQRELCDIFTALRHHRTLATAGRLLTRNSERHVKSPEQMGELFSDLPEAIANTLELSARLEFKLSDLGYEFPRYPVPEGETMMSFLRQRALDGFQERYGRASSSLQKRARRQVERELALIEKLALAGYFLIVWDIIHFCRDQGILAQGRGSAANSAVCYALGITAVDPVGMDLLFERFLSEERGEWPDIDIDLPSGDQREKVIQHLYTKYGAHSAAMTANVITYRPRSAMREAAKVMGYRPEEVDRLAKLVGSLWHDEIRQHPELVTRQVTAAGQDMSHPRTRRLLDLWIRLQGLPRHLGQHSGGMVV